MMLNLNLKWVVKKRSQRSNQPHDIAYTYMYIDIWREEKKNCSFFFLCTTTSSIYR